MNKGGSILICALSAFFAACNCGGADEIRSLDKISLASDDSAAYYDSKPGDTFSLTFFPGDHMGSRKGSRDCHQKDLAFSFENAWRTDLFEFFCNRALISGNDTIKPHSNLLGARICRHHLEVDHSGMINKQASRITLTGFKPPIINHTYTFFIKGVTDDNKIFKDSCHIYIH